MMNAVIKIRRAQQKDRPAIMRLLRQVLMVHHEGRSDLFKAHATKYTDVELTHIIDDDERPVFVATNSLDKVLGYAFCIYQQHVDDNVLTDIRTLYVDDICVDEAARGQGVGRALYTHVVAFAREQGFYNLTLNVWSCNPGAQRFYETMGLTPYRVGMELIL